MTPKANARHLDRLFLGILLTFASAGVAFGDILYQPVEPDFGSRVQRFMASVYSTELPEGLFLLLTIFVLTAVYRGKNDRTILRKLFLYAGLLCSVVLVFLIIVLLRA